MCFHRVRFLTETISYFDGCQCLIETAAVFFVLWAGGKVLGGKKAVNSRVGDAGDVTSLKFEEGLSEPGLTKTHMFTKRKMTEKPGDEF